MGPTLFFFGTLRDEDVLRIVLGSGFDHTVMQPGHLIGNRLELVQEEDFPMLVETWRTCLRDEFDLESLKEVLGKVEAGDVAIEEVRRCDR